MTADILYIYEASLTPYGDGDKIISETMTSSTPLPLATVFERFVCQRFPQIITKDSRITIRQWACIVGEEMCDDSVEELKTQMGLEN